MKIIGTKKEDVNNYPIDYASVLHLTTGILCYVISFFVLKTFLTELTSCLIAIIATLLISIFWEYMENTILLEIKVNKRQDNILNSQADTMFMFLGSIIGWLIADRGTLIIISVIGGLCVIYMIAMILTFKNFSRHPRH